MKIDNYCPICKNEEVACCCKTIDFEIPIRTVSESNKTGEHWTKKSKRHIIQRNLVNIFLKPKLCEIELPCKIHLVRIAPRKFDTDNLVSSFKSIRDQLGEMICGETIKGRGDGDDRIIWTYNQERGQPKTYAIRVEISF